MRIDKLNNQKKILIIDDSPDNLHILSQTLTKQGYRVACAKNVSTAIRALHNCLPDLILLDIRMPDINGYDLCKQLKADPRTREIPVIFLSVLDEVFDKVRAFKVGGVDYISKPFQLEELLARINNQLALQTAKAQIHQLNAQLEEKVRQRTRELEAANQQLKKEIGDRQRAEMLAKESQERLSCIFNSLQEVIWSAEAKTLKLYYLNPAAQKLYGRSVTEFLNNPNLWLEVVYSDDRALVESSVTSLLSFGTIELEYRIVRSDGEVRWVSDRRSVFYDSKGLPIRIDGIIDDITERKLLEQKLIHDALHDSLTALPNRTLFLEWVEMAITRAQKHKNYSFAVLFIDIDRFEIINDTLGHSIGDLLLIAIAALLKGCLRSNDTVAHLGGDRFTIILDEIQDLTDATLIAARIQTKLKSPFHLNGHLVVSSASISIITCSGEYKSSSELLRDADLAMCRAKHEGKHEGKVIFGDKFIL